VPTEIWSWHLRRRSRRRRRRRRGDGRHGALIKSRDSHMAGGEQVFQYVFAREQRGFFSGFSAKVRESVFQTHGCRERKMPHRERFAKEMAKGKTE